MLITIFYSHQPALQNIFFIPFPVLDCCWVQACQILSSHYDSMILKHNGRHLEIETYLAPI